MFLLPFYYPKTLEKEYWRNIKFMEYKSFCKQVESVMADRHPDCKVGIKDVTKNNGVTYKCLNVVRPGANISEAIYLETMYNSFQNGTSFMDIIEQIETTRKESCNVSFDVKFFTDFDLVRPRVMMRLVNYKKNEEMLANMPHRKYKDLAIVYYCIVGDKASDGIIMIKNQHVDIWNVCEQDLYETACLNDRKNNEYELIPLMGVYNNPRSYYDDGFKAEDDYMPFLKILTNKTRTYGATAIVSPGLLKELSKRFESCFYIIPSSIHELILIMEDDDSFDKDKAAILYSMVNSVNATEVKTEEVLSDNVYYYDKRLDEVLSYNEIASESGLE